VIIRHCCREGIENYNIITYIKQAFKLEHNFTKVKILFLFSEIYKNFTSSVEIKYEKNARMKQIFYNS